MGFDGVTLIVSRVGVDVTVRFADPMIEPEVAIILVAPALTPLARP
jgi:hypothetical protein